MAALLAGKTLKRNSGNHPDVKADEALKGKVVAFYFSAHWCPPCRGFTPVLKDFYNQVNKAGAELEIVFFSWDETADELKGYLKEAHGEWLYLPLDDPTVKALGDKFGVDGIPTLLVMKADGTVAIAEGREDVDAGTSKFPSWKAACDL